jgi:hypothetical protein
MEEQYYCYLLRIELDLDLFYKGLFKHDRHLCMSHGGFSIHKNRICHKHQCNAWRICPACLKQGDSEKPELIHAVMSLGEICFNDGVVDCQLCEFHHVYGPWAHRNDAKRLTAWRSEDRYLLLPEDSQIRIYEGVKYRVVEPPKLSDFFAEKEREARRVFINACSRNNHLSDKERMALRNKMLSDTRARIMAAYASYGHAAKVEAVSCDVIVLEENHAAEKVSEKVVEIAEPKKKRKYTKRAKEVAENQINPIQVEECINHEHPEEVHLADEVETEEDFQAASEACNQYSYLEDSSHGIRTSMIEIPDWHPQMYFQGTDHSEYIKALENGYKMSVNVFQGRVELLDNKAYLMALKVMGIEYPPLVISKFDSKFSMILCFIAVQNEISEWEQYKMIGKMLEFESHKKLAKWLEIPEEDLRTFMSHGKVVEENGDELLFEQMVADDFLVSEIALKWI